MIHLPSVAALDGADAPDKPLVIGDIQHHRGEHQKRQRHTEGEHDGDHDQPGDGLHHDRRRLFMEGVDPEDPLGRRRLATATGNR